MCRAWLGELISKNEILVRESESKNHDLSEFYLLVPRGLWYNFTALLTPRLGREKTEVRLRSISPGVTTSLSGITRDSETLPGFVVTQVRFTRAGAPGKIATKTSPAKLSIREMRHFWSAGRRRTFQIRTAWDYQLVTRILLWLNTINTGNSATTMARARKMVCHFTKYFLIVGGRLVKWQLQYNSSN